MFVKNLFPKFEADGGQGGGSNSQSEPQKTTTDSTAPADKPKDETMIPKSRFDEINGKYKEMLEKFSAIESAEAERQKAAEEQARKQAEEQGKFQELYQNTQKELEGYKAYESRTKELETVITSMVEAKLNSVPTELHDLIPNNLNAEQTLDWLNKAEAKGIFGKPEPKEIGKPMNHSSDSPKLDKANLSPLDKILSGLGK